MDKSWALQRPPPVSLALPVQGVIAGKGKVMKNATDAKRCPAALLRGLASSGRAADCAQHGWKIYLGYSPGIASNYGSPPISFSFGLNQRVCCKPPFLSAKDSEDAHLPIITEEVEGSVLGIMIGEEQWQALS
eukprot:4447343-Pleurochrysis_carterae.AAC.1